MYEGFMLLLQWRNILACVFGAIIGIIVGIIPGLTAAVKVTLLLPLGFALPPETAIIFWTSIFIAANKGDAITAILLNMPGTPSAAATCIDGYPLSQQGKSGEAICSSILGSMLGGLFGGMLLLLVAPPLSRFALQFGSAELVAIGCLGIVCISVLSRGNYLLGLLSGLIGAFLATVGFQFGVQRYTGGIRYIFDGFNLLWVIVGLFIVPQIIALGIDKKNKISKVNEISDYSVIKCLKVIFKNKILYIYIAIIGSIVGAIPGSGASISNWIGYSEAKRLLTKSDEKIHFGGGRIEGVIAPEIANNATAAAGLIPTLTLGIPGTGTLAVILGGFIMAGLRPGPALMNDQPDIFYAIIFSTFLAVFAFTIVGLLFSRQLAKITTISMAFLLPAIVIFTVFGAYISRMSYMGVYISFAIGVIAYFLKKYGLSMPSILLGYILAPILETNIDRMMLLSGARGLSIFRFILQRPIAIFIFLTVILVLLSPALKFIVKIFHQRQAIN